MTKDPHTYLGNRNRRLSDRRIVDAIIFSLSLCSPFYFKRKTKHAKIPHHVENVMY